MRKPGAGPHRDCRNPLAKATTAAESDLFTLWAIYQRNSRQCVQIRCQRAIKDSTSFKSSSVEMARMSRPRGRLLRIRCRPTSPEIPHQKRRGPCLRGSGARALEVDQVFGPAMRVIQIGRDLEQTQNGGGITLKVRPAPLQLLRHPGKCDQTRQAHSEAGLRPDDLSLSSQTRPAGKRSTQFRERRATGALNVPLGAIQCRSRLVPSGEAFEF